jgi:hypothetical protein
LINIQKLKKIKYRLIGIKFKIINFFLEIFLNIKLKRKFAFRNTFFYQDRDKNYLSELCDYYGSDKGSTSSKKKKFDKDFRAAHNYTDIYDFMFKDIRGKFKKVFECGIGKNNNHQNFCAPSLKVWRDYFYNANIYGADIDESLIIKDKRIKTFYVDQTSKNSIQKMWKKIIVKDFDLIIDDGLHRYNAGICFFENSFNKLKKNGFYIIEDVRNRCLDKYINYFSEKKIYYKFVIMRSKYKNFLPIFQSDNNLIIINKI